MKLATIAGISVLFGFLPSVADAAFVGRPDANVSFTAVGPAGMNIVGTNHDLTVSEDPNGNIAITVTLATLTTGMSLRDKHMREKYLEVQTYPTAVLNVARSNLKLPASGQSGTFDGSGTLTLHGKTKPVTVHYTAKSDGKTAYAVSGTMKIDMTDYGIEKPGYLGVSVNTSVDLSVSFTADDK
ncbi:MAG: YceI family protein [Labilithrix sp.]